MVAYWAENCRSVAPRTQWLVAAICAVCSSLQYSGNAEESSAEAKAVAGASAAASAVAVGKNGELRVGGQPFFPIFVWAQPGNLIPRHKSAGVNTLVPGMKVIDEPRPALLDKLQAQGMRLLCDADDFAPEVAAHPALLAWRFGDEPDQMKDGKPVVSAAQIIARYQEQRRKDPNHPVWVNFTARFYGGYNTDRQLKPGQYAEYGAGADIVSYDHYPVTGWNKPERISELYHATKAFVELFPGKAHWVIVETADQNLAWTAPETRGPTPQETRAMVWMCLVAGAKGIGYFTISFNPWIWDNNTPEMDKELLRISQDIAAIAPELLEGELIESAADNEQVKTRVLYYAGKITLIAINLSDKAVQATVTIKGLEGRVITLELPPCGDKVITSR